MENIFHYIHDDVPGIRNTFQNYSEYFKDILNEVENLSKLKMNNYSMFKNHFNMLKLLVYI